MFYLFVFWVHPNHVASLKNGPLIDYSVFMLQVHHPSKTDLSREGSWSGCRGFEEGIRIYHHQVLSEPVKEQSNKCSHM